MIDSKEVQRRVPRSRVQRWRDIKAGKFPAPVEVGPNKLGWFEDEVDAWMASRPRRTYGAEAETGKEYKAAELAHRYEERTNAEAKTEAARRYPQQKRRREAAGQAKEARE